MPSSRAKYSSKRLVRGLILEVVKPKELTKVYLNLKADIGDGNKVQVLSLTADEAPLNILPYATTGSELPG